MTDVSTDPTPAAAPAHDGVFTLGLAMAGAISAGAYTAGVLDFLVRALEAHEGSRGDPDGPRHRVVLKAMSGASAGGVCAALATAGLARGLTLTAARMRTGEDEQVYHHVLGPLHDIWVERIDLAQGDALLGQGDLRRGPLRSLINSDVLDRQAKAVLEPVAWNGRRHGWLAEELDVFLTVTHLDGVPFVAPFRQGDAPAPGAPVRGGHAMARHDFARHFRVHGLGSAPGGSPWLQMWGDAGVPLRLPPSGTPIPFHADGDAWSELRLTAFASGAFPAGLVSRKLRATADEFHVVHGGEGRGGAMPYDIDPAERPCPDHDFFRGDAGAALQVHSVDGGVCNNEPFELVRYAIRAKTRDPEAPPWRLAANPRSSKDADRAVIMVDPFPEGPEFRGETVPPEALALGPTLAKLLPTLLNQARFKPLELIEATDPDVHSRWLVAPSRRLHAGEAQPAEGDRRGRRLDRRGAEAIASGCLGGFGGFLHDAFRRHDFILGQRNCQSFLMNHFGVHPDNPLLQGWKGPHLQKDGDVPVIHLPPDLRREIPLPPWPAIPRSRLDMVKRKVNDRVDRVVDMTISSSLNGVGRFFGKIVYRIGGRGELRKWLTGKIDADLKAWELR